ncbi:CPBP family glutamic-type intramembrane protease [Flavobacterium sp. LS1R47]|uniref:CPBP family glutamic-type intramembrane protease n=1 Tax=Flavobacterium frigoritolerans TaxID=2987686 RepID=A0A9X3C9I4_9FLAO|nr:CPBP family glutamic-type intramembrane protease [Flavobacterium frigoritolerans]MCV9934076.1 CPBP family glutamic-type intramembrane protease [Flavobacterium frigoritolerans]
MSPLTPLIWLLTILPLFIFAFINVKKVNLKFLLFFVLYFLADCYLQQFSQRYLSLEFIGLKFTWIGKILSLILALGIVFSVSKKDREEIGFTAKSNSGKQLKFGVLFFLGFLLFDVVFKLILFPKGGTFDFETFAFQATMPGLTEEIVFRGISLWLLDKAFLPKWDFKGIKFGWGFFIVTILFGIGHGVVMTEDYQFKFDIITIIYLTLISSLSLGVLRKFSGNLIYPILGHNVINIINAIIRIL